MGVFFFLGIILFVLAVGALWKRRPWANKLMMLERAIPARAGDVPNVHPGSVVALTGIARSNRPLISEQTQTPCIYYDFEVHRRYERRRSPFSLLGNNRNRHHRRRRGREKVAENRQSAPFLIEDNTGLAQVIPEGAEFEPRQVLDHYEPEGGSNALRIPGLNIDLGIGWGNRTLGHKIEENLIPADSEVFVLGSVDRDGQISKHGGNDMIVTHRNPSTLHEEWDSQTKRHLYGGLVAAALSLGAFFIAGVQFVISAI